MTIDSSRIWFSLYSWDFCTCAPFWGRKHSLLLSPGSFLLLLPISTRRSRGIFAALSSPAERHSLRLLIALCLFFLPSFLSFSSQMFIQSLLYARHYFSRGARVGFMGPWTQQTPAIGFRLCWCCLEILNNFLTRSSMFAICIGPHKLRNCSCSGVMNKTDLNFYLYRVHILVLIVCWLIS